MFQKRQNGTAYTVELDMFLSPLGIKEGPIFLNGEIEFHGATKEEAIAEASLWQKDPQRRPPYFGIDLTEAKGVKSRDIAAKGAPEFIAALLAPYNFSNNLLFQRIATEFFRWADPEVEKLFSRRPVK